MIKLKISVAKLQATSLLGTDVGETALAAHAYERAIEECMSRKVGAIAGPQMYCDWISHRASEILADLLKEAK